MSKKSETMPKIMATATKKSKPLDLMTRGKTPDTEVVKVRVSEVAVKGRWRSLKDKQLGILCDSMSKIGLQTPISVRATKEGGFRLVAGRHRLKAAKRLGWKRIDAILMRGRKIDRQLWRDAENLHRTDLTALERAEAVTRWAKLVAEKAAQSEHPGGKQPHDKGVSKAAKVIGITRDNVRRSQTIASISSAARKAAADGGLADNEAALLKIANESTEDQVGKVHELAKGKRAVKPELSAKEKKQSKQLRRAFRRANKFRMAWEAAAPIVRQKFIKSDLKPTGSDS
jgi:ParB/RepB/Spo0J family partition protein